MEPLIVPKSLMELIDPLVQHATENPRSENSLVAGQYRKNEREKQRHVCGCEGAKLSPKHHMQKHNREVQTGRGAADHSQCCTSEQDSEEEIQCLM